LGKQYESSQSLIDRSILKMESSRKKIAKSLSV